VESALAVLGSTGPQGFGLALRLARAGERLILGSRSAERAEAALAKLKEQVPEADATAAENREAAHAADRILLSIPFDGLVEFLDEAGPWLAGKTVVDVIVPLSFRRGVAELRPVEGARSVGELVQQRVPTARVVSAFKNVPAELLQDLSQPVIGDVVLCGEDASARAEVAALAEMIPGLHPVDAGGLVNAHALEAITALLVNLNRRHKARTSITITGLP
jgi:8-hydroxy-5-deazaflavin:NADPH oxidoreductase